MHIAEGILSAPVLFSGAALAAAGVGIGLKKISGEEIVKAGVLASAFFLGSLVHFPIGPASIHLLLTGIIGVLLGWGAFPTILVALILQAVLLQYGGLTTLGVNTFNMGSAAIGAWCVFNLLHRRIGVKTAAFAAGFASILIGASLTACALVLSNPEFAASAKILFISQLPLAFIEGFITLAVIGVLGKYDARLIPGLT